MSHTYTKEAGRCILKDGRPLATIHGVGRYDPVEVDEFADSLVKAVNAHQAMKEALEEILDYSAISDSLDVDLEKYRKGTSGYHPNVLRALHKAKRALTLANGEETL